MPKTTPEPLEGRFSRAADKAHRRFRLHRGLLRLGILSGCGLALALLLANMPYAWD